jgi:hypothetical protein
MQRCPALRHLVPQPCDSAELPSVSAGTKTQPAGLSSLQSEVGVMPAWMELLLNVMAFAGFIGIATYHKRPNGKLPD